MSKAPLLLAEPFLFWGGENLYLFLSLGMNNKYFCRSFFPEGKKDYTKNQASWTVLYKKKCNLCTGEETVLYDRLKKKT